MSNTQSISAEAIASQRDTFTERFLQSAAGTFSLFSIYIGDRLGLYRALAEGGPSTSQELAARTKTHERYIRELLEQQTVAGILEVENENHSSETRRFSLPPGHVEPLIDCGSLNYVVPLAQLLVGAVRPLQSVLEVYRIGGGPYKNLSVPEPVAGPNGGEYRQNMIFIECLKSTLVVTDSAAKKKSDKKII